MKPAPPEPNVPNDGRIQKYTQKETKSSPEPVAGRDYLMLGVGFLLIADVVARLAL